MTSAATSIAVDQSAAVDPKCGVARNKQSTISKSSIGAIVDQGGQNHRLQNPVSLKPLYDGVHGDKLYLPCDYASE